VILFTDIILTAVTFRTDVILTVLKVCAGAVVMVFILMCGGACWKCSKKDRAFTDEQLNDIREVFDTYDTSCDGALQFDEFILACKGLGLSVSKEDCKDKFDELDADGNGSLSFEEFTEFCADQLEREEKILNHKCIIFPCCYVEEILESDSEDDYYEDEDDVDERDDSVMGNLGGDMHQKASSDGLESPRYGCFLLNSLGLY
jgi:hypothetical protein